MKKIFIAIVMAVLVAILGCTSADVTGKVVLEPKEKVSVRLPIPVVEAGQTPFYVADDLGFYDEVGLDVEFNLGSPETNPVKMVASGSDDFGVLGGPDTLLVARSKGQPLVAVSVIHRNSDFPVILTLKDSGIDTLEELEDKKIGFFYGHISTDVLRNLLSNTEYEEIDVGFDYSQLISKKIDAEWAFRVTAGLNLPEKGLEINTISPSDYGINTHGYTIFVTEEMIEERPDVIKKFIEATGKGIQATLDNPSKAVDTLAKRSDKLNKELEYKRLLLYNEVTSEEIGSMDFIMFKETYDRLKEEKVIAKDFDVREAFTTEFIK
ncbi:ABC transporter substrate-binding protein [Candidatus Woesearchaeota archaeon]|nr:ABC transporter substrate-binding protein [Candidatus Woesearchaeota archaeon]